VGHSTSFQACALLPCPHPAPESVLRASSSVQSRPWPAPGLRLAPSARSPSCSDNGTLLRPACPSSTCMPASFRCAAVTDVPPWSPLDLRSESLVPSSSLALDALGGLRRLPPSRTLPAAALRLASAHCLWLGQRLTSGSHQTRSSGWFQPGSRLAPFPCLRHAIDAPPCSLGCSLRPPSPGWISGLRQSSLPGPGGAVSRRLPLASASLLPFPGSLPGLLR